jgi:anthranilate synthase component 1
LADVFPDKKKFLRLSRKYNVIPVVHEILADLETPVSCFLKIGERPYSYLLESVEGGEKMARYTFIGASPSLVFQSKGRQITLDTPGKDQKRFNSKHGPLAELEKLLKGYRQAPAGDLPPFYGGAVGYLGYDTARFFEKISDKNRDAQQIPDSLFIFTDTLFIFDHIERKLKIVCNAFLDKSTSPEKAYERTVEKVLQERHRLENAPAEQNFLPVNNTRYRQKISSNFNRAAFRTAVLKAKRYIKAGDIFQVVLSQAFRTKLTAAPFDVYRALRSLNPSPYMFYLNGGNFQMVGSSPEVHVRYERAKAMLRPIAGTRPRGSNHEEDQKLEKELLNDKKERAEHLMLVDLGRNDLGRVCEYKSVNVPEFMQIERYSHVMHLVSLVEGRLKKNKSSFDLLRATFPAGTVSGAPKVRAMNIIDELENQKRGFYAGIVGYFGFSGNLDSCIAIRTILVKNKTAWVQAGAGIVADSDPDKEYQETVNKAKALMKAIEIAERGVSE